MESHSECFFFFCVSGLRPVPQVSNTSSETRRSLEPERCRTNRADGPWGHGKGFIFHPEIEMHWWNEIEIAQMNILLGAHWTFMSIVFPMLVGSRTWE